MALTYKQLQEKKRRMQGVGVDPELFSDWTTGPGEAQPTDITVPDDDLFSDWPIAPSAAAQPDGIAAPSGKFAQQEREPRVLPYSQRAIVELEQGLSGLRLPNSPITDPTTSEPGSVPDAPYASIKRLREEAMQDLVPLSRTSGSDLGERLEHYFPGQVPTVDELSRKFLPGQLPGGWEPLLRDVLEKKYYPPEDIEHLVSLTKLGIVPMISSIEEVPEYEVDWDPKDTFGGMKVFAQGLMYLPKQTAASVVKSLQGTRGAGVTNRGRFDKLVELAHKDTDEFARRAEEQYKNKKFLPGIPIKELAQLPRNISFSLTSMGHGLAAGIPTAMIPAPGARPAALAVGTVASGVAAFKMASYDIMQNYLELKNDESMRNKGRGITPAEEKSLKKEFEAKAVKYGLWEAVPEMIGNAAQVGTIFAPLSRMLGNSMATRILAKMGGVYGEEMLTEAVTQIGQSQIEAEADFPGAERLEFIEAEDWLTALKQVAPQTFLLTTTLGGLGSTYAEVRAQLKSEIGENHDQFKRLLDKLKKRHPEAQAEAEAQMPNDMQADETGVPDMIKVEDIPEAAKVRQPTQEEIRQTVASTEFDQGAVEYMLETGMTPEEIVDASAVMEDMLFQRTVEGEISPEDIIERDIPPEEAAIVAARRERMTPVEGDTVLLPHLKQTGKLTRWNNDGTAQVSLPSGMNVKVQPDNVISAKGAKSVRRGVKQEMEAAEKPEVKADIPEELSPVATAREMLSSLPYQSLLNAIGMVAEGDYTAKEAVYTLSYGNPEEKLIRDLAAQIGEEQFVDMMVDAVSEVAEDVDAAIKAKEQAVPRAADPASQEYSDVPPQQFGDMAALRNAIHPEAYNRVVNNATEEQIREFMEFVASRHPGPATVADVDAFFGTNWHPEAPPPYTVPLNEYLLTKEPPELRRVRRIKETNKFQLRDEKTIDRYIQAVENLVAKYAPEEMGNLRDTIAGYYAGNKMLSDIDATFASLAHRRIASVQFGDVMEATGIDDPLQAALYAHEESVRDALERGLPVTESVLEPYPYLIGRQVEDSQLNLPGLDALRAENIEAQKRRIEERGGDQPDMGLSVHTVGPGGLPLEGRGRAEFEQEMAKTAANNPDVAAALSAGRNVMNDLRGMKERWRQWRKAIGEFVNPTLDKALREIMPQYVDDKRTGLLPIATKAQMQALIDAGSLWGDLNKSERDALMNLIFERSLLETGLAGKDLPRGLTVDEVQKSYNEHVSLLQQRAPEVLNIMNRYQTFMRALADSMVDRGWMKPDDIMDFYAPHIILDYTPAYFLEHPYVAKQGRKPFQAYLKKREGSTRDIIANQEAIISRMATIYADMMFEDWVTGQLEKHDIFPKMTVEAKLDTFGKRPSGRIGEPSPHGLYEVGNKRYRGFQYMPGNMIYRAAVVDESLLSTAFKEAMEDIATAQSPTDEKMIEDIANRGFDAIEKYLIGVGPRGGDALRVVRALGKRQRVYLIPEEMYNDMKHLTSTGEYSVMTEIMHDLRRLTRQWKIMTTQITGGIPFHIRNEIGDVINMLKTAGWEPLRYLPSALKVLYNINNPENLTPFEQRAREIVLDKAVLEAGHLSELQAKSFQLKGNEVNDMKKIWNWYQRLSGYRELSNRVAMVLYNLDRYEHGKPIKARDIKHELYGLDMPSQIAYAARVGLIDYGDVPAWFRRRMSGFWFPFATFYIKNLNQWRKLILNKQAWMKGLVPGYVIKHMASPLIMTWLWNHYGPFKKVEEGLGFRKRKWWHVNLWQWDYDANGEPQKGLVWSPEHPSDLALEAIGADSLLENIDLVRTGKLTPKEAALKQIYELGIGPFEMGQRLLNPMVGAFIDILRNKNPYTGIIVPKGEESLPEYDKLRYYWFPHIRDRLITPLGQFMTENRSDEPPLLIKLFESPVKPGENPILGPEANEQLRKDVTLRLPRRPLDVLRGLGFYVVDLHKETDRDWWQMRSTIGARRAHQMRKFRQAYVDSQMELMEFISSDKAMQLMQEARRKDFAVRWGVEELAKKKMPPRGTVLGYLLSHAVQLDKAKSKLRDPYLTDDERKAVEKQMRAIKELRRLESLDRIRDEELPATMKQMLRRIIKKAGSNK